MKEIIATYKQNREIIENLINTTVQKLQIQKINERSHKDIFRSMKYAKLVYYVDSDYTLVTPYYYPKGKDKSRMGSSKSFYFNKVLFNVTPYFLSNPYINGSTGKINVTYAAKLEDGFIVIDFDVIAILEHLSLIQSHRLSRIINTFIYGLMGFSLLFFATFLGIYAIYIFGASVFDAEHFNLESTFKAIIALTLGLAIFDLSRTILEQEIFFKSIANHNKNDNTVFVKFLISIIIALSIESLMVVFKIALTDHREMIHAFYLIIGVSFMIFAVGKYSSYIQPNKKSKKQK
jgi:hypothetical protein